MKYIVRERPNANYTGRVLEKFIEDRLIEKGYQFIEKNKFKAATYLKQPIYTKQVYVGKSIYDTKMYADFVIYHPEKYPDCLVIESKWQQSGGSVDEKYPYLILNIQTKYPYRTVLLLDGKGYKKEAEAWLKKQEGNNLMHVLNMAEFQTWANKGNL